MPTREDVWRRLEDALSKDNWIRGVCKSCGIVFYGRKPYELCGNKRCGEPALVFDDGEHKEIVSLEELGLRITDFFRRRGYLIEKPLPILRWKRERDSKVLSQTIFTVAGVQFLFDTLYDETPLPGASEKVFLAQPSVRLIASKSAGFRYGIYTSFVNICTEAINPSMDEYLEDFFSWLELLGGFLGGENIRMTIVDVNHNWNGRETSAVQVYFYYRSFALGDANFHYDFPQKTRENVTMGDIGLGLEGLCCCINKVNRDFDVIGPYLDSVRGKGPLVDRIRTLVLVIGSGILPGNTPYGTKIRRLIRDVSDIDGDSFRWFDLVQYFYAFWSNFAELSLSPIKIRETIRNEIYRQNNMGLAAILKISVSNEEAAIPTYEFVDNCINGMYKRKVSLKMLDEAIKKSFALTPDSDFNS